MSSDFLKEKKNLIIAVACILLVFVVALIYVSSESTRQARLSTQEKAKVVKEEEKTIYDNDKTGATGASRKVSPLPQVNYTDYGTPASLPALPRKASVIRFGQGLSQTEATTLGQRFGYDQVLSKGDQTLVYNLQDPASYGYMQVDKKTGSILFRSYADNAALPKGADPKEVAQQFLRKLGFVDPAVECGITYSRTDVPDATFVECHRSWETVGLPILNLPGLLNVPEDKPLTDLALGMVDDNDPKDPRIVNVSTGQDGLSRPDDFNSAVVVVGKEGRVLAARSNLKQVSSTQDIDVGSGLFTPQDAWQQIISGKTHTVLTVPAGQGTVDANKVFPAGQAVASNTTVTDVILAYVESPAGSQQYAAPTYLIRGKTQLSSGYEARYMRALPANTLELSAATYTGEVAGISTNSLAQGPDPSSLKLRTLTLVPTYPETPQSVAMAAGCMPSELQLSPQYDLSPYGVVGPWSIAPFVGGKYKEPKREGNYFLIPADKSQLPEINSVVAAFDSLTIPDAASSKAVVREMDNLLNEWSEYSLCPLRLTGSSPSIFLYAPQGVRFTVKPVNTLTYVDPRPTGGTWETEVKEDGLRVMGVARDYLYYEYTNGSFERPQKGWNVAKHELGSLAGSVGVQLSLTEKETARLAFELNHAAADVASDKLFVGLIPQSAVDGQLPLSVKSSSPVTVTRLHFYVGGGNGAVQSPNLTPVSRNSYMALELGAVSGK